MARIQPTTLETAPEASRPILVALTKELGLVPNLYATIGNSPQALAMLLGASDILAKGELSAREIEIINTFTSELNRCAYCVSAHAMMARKAGLSQDEIDELRDRTGGAMTGSAMRTIQ